MTEGASEPGGAGETGEAGETGDGREAAGSSRRHVLGRVMARSGHLEYDRILFFSDAVFAIAITLLVVDLPAQLELNGKAIESGQVLKDAGGSILSFAISFLVIGLFWMSHHGLFRFVSGFDRRLIFLNLLFLGSIAFLPYPTALLGRAAGSQVPAVVFYAACVGTAGLLMTVTWAYACLARSGLTRGIDSRGRWFYALSIGRVPAVFFASIGIAQVSARAAQYSWLAILAIDVVINRYFRGVRTEPVPDPELPAD